MRLLDLATVDDCNRIIKACIERSVGRRWINNEDVMQAGWVGLLEGIKRFDMLAGVEWYTYCWWWIRKRVYEEVQRQLCGGREVCINEVNVGIRIDMEERYFRFYELKECLRMFMRESLSEVEYDVIGLRMVCGKSFKEIANLLELSKGEVIRIFNIAFEKLKQNKERLKSLLEGKV